MLVWPLKRPCMWHMPVQEPTKHQYDWDVATTMGFLNQYGLSDEFKLNVECNHATLAGHSCDHELQARASAYTPALSRQRFCCRGCRHIACKSLEAREASAHCCTSHCAHTLIQSSCWCYIPYVQGSFGKDSLSLCSLHPHTISWETSTPTQATHRPAGTLTNF